MYSDLVICVPRIDEPVVKSHCDLHKVRYAKKACMSLNLNVFEKTLFNITLITRELTTLQECRVENFMM